MADDIYHGRSVPHLPINTRGLAVPLTHRLLLYGSLWAPKLVSDSYHKTEPPWPTEYHIKAVRITAVAAKGPAYYTPRGRIRSVGEGRLVYTLPTMAGPSLQHTDRLYGGCYLSWLPSMLHLQEDTCASTLLKTATKRSMQDAGRTHWLSKPSTQSRVTHNPGDSAESCLSQLFQKAPIALTTV